ncbi:MBL fold metallo-hydrolase [Chitinophaga agrisoli]|uniref:MBL fold metallo-hydrolase n=1 Tax=Chitinophaga agrisoli TaxID=2607653 RepID=A0A5B2VYE9_9BACT|nr:MBL fold metallo-hydrolase [Chitinophaga agrisoli]KAA2243580.1 MBL fold metallo-hydrolase [Chitinophaga agrisoli]
MKQKKTTPIQENLYKKWFLVAPGVWGIKDIMVNVYLIHANAGNHWVLVDTGLPTAAAKIRQVSAHLFWPQTSPSAIILTHGHFDHTGSLKKLAEEWDVPVYAHYLEAPYLTGRSSYPPPDPTAGGGLMTLLSWLFPKHPKDLNGRLLLLPEDGSIPGLPDWRYIHTPGHAPGHISLYRERDGVLLTGDAVVTTQQESLWSVITQAKKLCGPPRYFTCNWHEAQRTVQKLADLEPSVIASGHGKPMKGNTMKAALHRLAANFDTAARPSSGRYVKEAAVAGVNGVEYLPAPNTSQRWLKVGAALALIGISGLLYRYTKKK